MKILRFLGEIAGLQTSRGRLLAFAVLSVAVFVSPYDMLAHLSFWQALGLHWAPSIGLTRAYHLLLHGHPVAAWHRNPLIYLVIALGVPLLIKDSHRLMRRYQYRRATATLTPDTVI